MSGFEDDDGNLAPLSGGFDWNSFAPVKWPNVSPHLAPYRQSDPKTASDWTFKGFEDAQAVTTDSAFAGGTKQDQECPTVIQQKADNKADLKRVYMAKKIGSNGHVYLTLAWVRIPQNTTSPSAHVAFEFNKASGETGNNNYNPCGGNSDGLVHRSAGDMLIVYDFEGGGGAPVIGLSRWVTSGTCQISSDKPPCWGVQDTLTAGEAEAAVNTGVSPYPGGVSDALAPPLVTASDTSSVTANLGVKEFGEAGIDLTSSGVFSSNICNGFGTAFAVSRTSGNSGTAQMKDLVGPGPFNLSNCGSVNVTKTTSDNSDPSGVVFSLYSGSDTSTAAIATCTVGSDGQCGSDPSFSNLQPGTYTIDETTGLPGYSKDSSLPYTFTIAAGDDLSFTFDNTAEGADVDLSKVDDNNDPVVGAVFSLYAGSDTSTVAIDTCTTDSSGACIWAGTGTGVVHVDAGTYTVDETTVPTGYTKDPNLPDTFTVANQDTKHLSYTDAREFKVIVLVCRQTDDTLYPSSVTIEGDSAGTSLSSTAAANAGLDESALCGITDGAKGGLHVGDRAADPISIPQTQP